MYDTFKFYILFLGETDWKIVSISKSDPLADSVNGIFNFCNF